MACDTCYGLDRIPCEACCHKRQHPIYGTDCKRCGGRGDIPCPNCNQKPEKVRD